MVSGSSNLDPLPNNHTPKNPNAQFWDHCYSLSNIWNLNRRISPSKVPPTESNKIGLELTSCQCMGCRCFCCFTSSIDTASLSNVQAAAHLIEPWFSLKSWKAQLWIHDSTYFISIGSKGTRRSQKFSAQASFVESPSMQTPKSGGYMNFRSNLTP